MKEVGCIFILVETVDPFSYVVDVSELLAGVGRINDDGLGHR